MSEFSAPDDRWVQSVESEGTQGLAELARDAAALVPHFPATFNAGDVMRQSYTSEATDVERNTIKRALTEDIRWVYDSEIISDGLFAGTEHSRVVQGQTLSRYVLSGALGDSLFKAEPELLERSEQFGDSYVKKAIFIGGAALQARSKSEAEALDGGLFTSMYDEARFMWETHTGGTIHGDFYAGRIGRPVYGVADTIWGTIEHPFAPAPSVESVAAYHSTEPGIVRALLYQLVTNASVEPADLRERLVAELSGRKFNIGGFFSDYGDNDGSHQARMLAHMLKRGNLQTEGTVFRSIVYPSNHDYSFEVVLTPNGALLVNKHEGVEQGGMLIENQDIEPFIVAMATGGGGRTAPGAILNVIDGLVEMNKTGR